MNKKRLYESIMRNVAREVKKALNEGAPYGAIDDMEKTTAVLNFAEGPDTAEEYLEDVGEPDPDYVEVYDHLLNDGIDLTKADSFNLMFFGFPEGWTTDATTDYNTPVPSNMVPAEIRHLIVVLEDSYDDNYLDISHIIKNAVNVVDTVEYTDGYTFKDTWYVVDLKNGQRCIIVDGTSRDTFFVAIV